jgi:hypothetical protein
MDWLKDKKNQPIVAAGLALFIVIMGVVLYMFVFKGSGSSEAPTSDASSPADTSTPTGFDTGMPAPDASATGGTAPAQPAAATGSKQVAAKPMEAWRADPFLPPGYKPPRPGGPKPKPHIRDLPVFKIPIPGAIARDRVEQPDTPQPLRRMAGLVLGDRVYAIIESGGKSQVVQPGDMLEDRLASVYKIEKDGVILKTVDPHPRYITVRMSQGVRTTASAESSGSSPSGRPGRPGRFPGGPTMGPPGPGLEAPQPM